MERKYRLLKNYQFENLIVNGKFVSNRDFFLYYCYRDDLGTIRIGITVPKKLVKKAFARNKIKRQIRSMLIDVEKNWAINIVLIVRKNYLNNDYTNNKVSLTNLLGKIPLKEKKEIK
ncbi:MAG: ribonuclease P protein component [Spiroplasma sp.]|nr:ribonuclease P protein component [Spiroplasma sp.]